MSSSLFSNSSMPNQTSNIQSQSIPGQMGQIKQMYQTLQKASNPKGMMEQMLESNPQMKMVQNQINQFGDPKTAFYSVAKNMGLSDNQIQNGLNSLSQFLKI